MVALELREEVKTDVCPCKCGAKSMCHETFKCVYLFKA